MGTQSKISKRKLPDAVIARWHDPDNEEWLHDPHGRKLRQEYAAGLRRRLAIVRGIAAADLRGETRAARREFNVWHTAYAVAARDIGINPDDVRPKRMKRPDLTAMAMDRIAELDVLMYRCVPAVVLVKEAGYWELAKRIMGELYNLQGALDRLYPDEWVEGVDWHPCQW